MKKSLLFALPLLALATASVHAQTISWGSAQNIVGDSDVIDPGTLVDAATFYSKAATLTVNGVTFNTLSAGGPGFTDASGLISVTTPGGGGAGAFGNPFSTTSPSSVAYSDLTSVLGFTVGNTGTVTLSGLTAGSTYEVEAWSYYTGQAAGGSTIFTGNTSVNLNGDAGQFSIGTFTATGSTETFGYAVDNGDNHAIVNAVSVFATNGQVVPEPSTYAMMLAGFGALVIMVRRKRAAQI